MGHSEYIAQKWAILSGLGQAHMKNDSDNIRNLLLWLLHKFHPTFSSPSGNGLHTSEACATKANQSEVGSDATSMKPALPQGSMGISSELPRPSTFSNAAPLGMATPKFSKASRDAYREIIFQGAISQTTQSFNFGEIHAVQERFHNLLKQRFLSEYENNPPLFPWESEVAEYPVDVADFGPAAASSLWDAHVSELAVPRLLPAPLLKALFDRCQAIAQMPVKQGVRLVRAVEELFPDQLDILEPIADMVLVPAYRSADAATRDALTQELTAVAEDYDAALPEQQVALSMLAAQEILGALTLSLTAKQPSETRLWMTDKGALNLTATYAEGALAVSVALPAGGQVNLKGDDVERQVTRSRPGSLDMALTDLTVGRTYLLKILLTGEVAPLSFAIHLEQDLA